MAMYRYYLLRIILLYVCSQQGIMGLLDADVPFTPTSTFASPELSHSPHIETVHPRTISANIDTTATIVLTGRFPAHSHVVVDGQLLPPARVMILSSNLIVITLLSHQITLGSTAPVKRLTLHVISPYYIRSNTSFVTISRSLPVLDVDVVSPPSCAAARETLAVLASVRHSFNSKSFLFSVWTKRPKFHFVDVIASNAGVASLPPSIAYRNLAIVFVTALLPDGRSSERVEILHQIPSCTLPLLVASSKGSGIILHAAHSPLAACGPLDDARVEFEWLVNGSAVFAPTNPLSSLDSVAHPYTAHLGAHLVVAALGAPCSYSLRVRVLQSANDSILLSAMKQGSVQRERPALSVLLNGGARYLAVPLSSVVRLYSRVIGTQNLSDVRYGWECVRLLASDRCPIPLFTDASSFQGSMPGDVESFHMPIDGMGIAAGDLVEYKLTVFQPGYKSAYAFLKVEFKDTNFVPLPDMVVRSFLGRAPGEVVHDLEFECYEHAAFWASENAAFQGDVDFRLVRGGQDNSDVLRNKANITVQKKGFWHPLDRSGPIIVLDLSRLSSDQYILYGSGMGDASEKVSVSWFFSVKECASVVLHDPPMHQGTTQTIFYASASRTRSDKSAIFVFSLERAEYLTEHRLVYRILSRSLFRDPLSYEDRHSALGIGVVQSHGRRVFISFTIPVAGDFFISLHMYDDTGSKLLSFDRSTASISVSVNDTADIRHDTREQRLRRAITLSDTYSFLSELSNFNLNSTLSPAMLDLALNLLTNMSSTRITVAFTAGNIVNACASLIELDPTQNLTRLVVLRQVVERVVSTSLAMAVSNKPLRRPLQRFYSSSYTALFVAQKDGRSFSIYEQYMKLVTETRQSAVMTIAALLSTGPECAGLDQLEIRYIGPHGELVDEYHIGVECFKGQINSLARPALYELCNFSGIENKAPGDIEFVFVFKQAELDKATFPEGIMKSPIFGTHFLHRKTDRGLLRMVAINRADECYRTRMIVQVTELDIKTNRGIKTLDDEGFRCRGAGLVMQRDDLAIENVNNAGRLRPVSEFWVLDNGSVSTWVRRTGSGAVQLLVNATILQRCETIESSSNLSSSRRRGLIVGIVITSIALLSFSFVLLCQCVGIPRTVTSHGGTTCGLATDSSNPMNGSVALETSPRLDIQRNRNKSQPIEGSGRSVIVSQPRCSAASTFPNRQHEPRCSSYPVHEKELSCNSNPSLSVPEYVQSDEDSSPKTSSEGVPTFLLRDEFGRGFQKPSKARR